MLDPTIALQTYRSSCQERAKCIDQFMAKHDSFDLFTQEADILANMVDTMMEQTEAMQDLWSDIVEVAKKYPGRSDKDTLIMEWSRIMSSTKRVINKTLAASGQYTSPVNVSLDRSNKILSVREHDGSDANDYDTTESEYNYHETRSGHARTTPTRAGAIKCSDCGTEGKEAHNKEACNEYGRHCRRCGVQGHLGQVCHERLQNKTNTTDQLDGKVDYATNATPRMATIQPQNSRRLHKQPIPNKITW